MIFFQLNFWIDSFTFLDKSCLMVPRTFDPSVFYNQAIRTVASHTRVRAYTNKQAHLHMGTRMPARTLPSLLLISQKASLYRMWTDNHVTVPPWTQLDTEQHRRQGNVHIHFTSRWIRDWELQLLYSTTLPHLQIL